MLTNKEIRAFPMPKISQETRALALQNAEHNVFVITCGRIKSNVVINVFSKDENGDVSLFYRYFVKRYDALLYNVRKNKITNGYLSNAFGYYGTVVSTQKQAEKLKKYINPESTSDSAGNVIESYDKKRSVMRSRLRKAEECSEIDGIMHKVRKVPKSFEKTIKKTMSYSKYIFYDRRNDFGKCSCCGSEIRLSELPKFRDKESGKCPKCGEKIRFKSELKRQRYNTYDEKMAVLVQKYARHVLIIRYFHIIYDYNVSQVPKVSVKEVVRTLIDYDKHKICDYEWYYYNGELRWCLPQCNMFNPDGFHHSFLNGSLHKAGLAKELRAADVNKYLQGWAQVNQFMKADSAEFCYMHIRYPEHLALNPILEPITKCGFYNLTSDYMNKQYIKSKFNKDEKSILKILSLKNRTQLREALALNINSDQLHIIQSYNQTTDINRPVSDILRIAEEYDGREESAFVLSDSRLRKLSKYLDSICHKKSERNNFIADYFDYLHNCESLNYIMTSDIVLYPKNFKRAHDKAAVDVKSKNLEEECKKIAKLLPDMHDKYDFSNDDFLIKAPDSGRDIIYEGQSLEHCVSSYVPRVAEGSTVILFIRRKNEPDKPYVTVEVRNDKVVQVRGFSNQKPESDVTNFMEQFKREKCIA